MNGNKHIVMRWLPFTYALIDDASMPYLETLAISESVTGYE
jgi:hypothetical protein